MLLDNSFASLPAVVAEGRRVINNIERVASLFLDKTTYALLFALVGGVRGVTYPFLPRQLTLVGTFTIGVPAFFLALAPNPAPVRDGFLGRVLRIAIPGGLLASLATFVAFLIAQNTAGLSLEQERTTATLVLASSAIIVLTRVARPLQPWKVLMIVLMATFLALTLIVDPLRDFFELVVPPRDTMLMAGVVIAATAMLLQPFCVLGDRIISWGEQRLAARAR